MIKRLTLIIACIGICTTTVLKGQQKQLDLARTYLEHKADELGLSPEDIQDYFVTDQYTSSHNGVTHIYLQQRFGGISIRNAQINIHIWKNQAVKINSSFVAQLQAKVHSTIPATSAEQAILTAAKSIDVELALPLVQLKTQAGTEAKSIFMDAGISSSAIPVELELISNSVGGLQLAWKTEIASKKGEHHWHLWVDAISGKIIEKSDQVIHCNWRITDGLEDQIIRRNSQMRNSLQGVDYEVVDVPSFVSVSKVLSAEEYDVFPLPIESPNHGQRTTVSAPADSIASPFGWHDTDGMPGAEFTITRGNNVWAQENQDGDPSSVGQSPDGGPNLHFNAPYNPGQGPASNVDAATTNLFYWNNIIHDVCYQYGFDEVSGNFQENNYGKGGNDGDFVNAFSQDGRGTNNAFFFSPPDGNSGQMAMFLFTSDEPANYLTVNTPESISGTYQSVVASFGGAVPDTMLTARIIPVDDGSGSLFGCDSLINDSLLMGNFALMDRGTCSFIQKIQNAQDAGAVAAIVVNDQPGPPFSMGGGVSNTITIPSIMVSQADGNAIKAALASDSVIATLLDPGNLNGKDAAFDNGIIAHEYGHGVSIRLTGGPSVSSCLFNDEQAGEGWSDFLGLVMTAKASDTGPKRRGVGTFSLGEATNGNGFRQYAYSTDMSINPHTYDDVKNQRFGSFVSVHGVGSVMCAMLWEMYWGLVDEYGFDPDLYYGSGGNNIAIQLVLDGMKLQPCLPGFVDVRDAILLADEINYNGANKCIIWKAFAKRGLGFSASQGSSNDITDGVEAFDLPPECTTLIVEKTTSYEGIFPGSPIPYTLFVQNKTDGQVTQAIVTDTLPDGTSFVEGSSSCNVSVANGIVTFDLGTIPAGGSVSCDFKIKVDPTAEFSTFSFFNDIEAGANGFVVLNQQGQTKWELSTSSPRSGSTSWFVANDTLTNDQVLQLPSMNLSGNPTLTFWHQYNTESRFDGGVIEILPTSQGNQWVDLGPYIINNGYTDTLVGINPIGQRPAFTGRSRGYIQTKIALDSFVNQLVFIRFRFISNAANQAEGWWIDDISIGNLKTISNTACVSSTETQAYCSTQAVETVIFENWATAVEPIEAYQAVSIFPNPATKYLSIGLETADGESLFIKIINLHGQEVFRREWEVNPGENRMNLDIAALARGVYSVEIMGKSGRLVRKVILN